MSSTVEHAGRIEPGLIEPEVAMAYLGNITEDALRMLRAKHKLPFVKIGRRVLYPVDGLKRWIIENTERGDRARGIIEEIRRRRAS